MIRWHTPLPTCPSHFNHYPSTYYYYDPSVSLTFHDAIHLDTYIPLPLLFPAD